MLRVEAGFFYVRLSPQLLWKSELILMENTVKCMPLMAIKIRV
jgi:hypothetical protein